MTNLIIQTDIAHEEFAASTMNLCDELRSPMRERGCQEFTTSYHCPVGLLNPKSPERHPEILPNGYWLYADADADIDINQLRTVLEAEVLAKSLHLTPG